MKKLKEFYSGTTLVDFSFLLRLIVRYRIVSLFITVLVVGTSISIYYLQTEFYKLTLSFRDMSDKENSAISSISQVLGDKKDSSNNRFEILRMKGAYDFGKKIADVILSSEEIHKLDFSVKPFDKNMTIDKLLAVCRDKSCPVDRIVHAVESFYKISENGKNSNSYTLQVESSTKEGATTLIHLIAKAIRESRIENIKKYYKEQEEIAKELLDRKKTELEALGYEELLKEKELLDIELVSENAKLDIFNKIYYEQKSGLSKVESQMETSKTLLDNSVNLEEFAEFENRNTLKENIKKLTSDISALEMSGIAGSEKDKEIIRELSSRLEKNRQKLRLLGQNKRSLVSTEEFLAQNDEKLNYSEFDYKVYREQVGKTAKQYQEMIRQREDLIRRKLDNASKYDRIKPALAFLVSLQEKYMQASLLKSTAISDIVFDQHPSFIQSFKKIRALLLLVVMSLVWFILIFVAMFIRYLLDSKIYDEQDIKRLLGNITVIGESPKIIE